MVGAKPRPPEIETLELALTWAPTVIKSKEMRGGAPQMFYDNFNNYIDKFKTHSFVVHGLWAFGAIQTRIVHINSDHYDCSGEDDDLFISRNSNTKQRKDKKEAIRRITLIEEIDRYWPGILSKNQTGAFKRQWVRFDLFETCSSHNSAHSYAIAPFTLEPQEKHGLCIMYQLENTRVWSSRERRSYRFFEVVTDLAEEVMRDLAPIVTKYLDKEFKLGDFRTDIENKWEKQVYFHLDGGPIYCIEEIHFCFHPKTTTKMDCAGDLATDNYRVHLQTDLEGDHSCPRDSRSSDEL